MKVLDEENPSFFLPSSSSTFNERQKSIFDVLDKAEKEKPLNRYTERELLEAESKSGRRVTSTRKEMKQFLGKESIFKRPEVPLNKAWKRKMPDFQKNPHKWTKYSLEDVSLDEMTDKSNSATAMAFMKELSGRSKDADAEDGSEPKRVVFNKHVKLLKESVPEVVDAESTDKPVFVSGKYVMPEYVVGQKAKPKKAEKKASGTATTQIKLDHLLDEDE